MEHSWEEIIWYGSGLVSSLGTITMVIINHFWTEKTSLSIGK